ncbi:hypothetical protein H0H93_009029 [Arthromyces matolae]|nr:hypothetical protein H0H93_009029 [Arthromyces matolae]
MVTCLTNNVNSKLVPPRLREFSTASRIWNHLAMKRRSGQSHGIDDLLPDRRDASLAVRCPACPEIGFNLQQSVVEGAQEDEAHKYTLFLSADGNFRLQRKNKNIDPDDVALNKGNAYFVLAADFKDYLKAARQSKGNSKRGEEDSPTCPHLRAAQMQNVVKFKNAAITGVIALQCARHGFYLPQGVMDMFQGEAYANTDYAVAWSLRDQTQQRWLRFIYDIFCRYGIHLLDRFNEWFPGLADLVSKIDGAIPKMHIMNHVQKCMLFFSLNYQPYSGETYGEGIEGGWAEQNQSAGSTKEMNDGHRHDSLDDFFGYWNWSKLTRMRMYSALI